MSTMAVPVPLRSRAEAVGAAMSRHPLAATVLRRIPAGMLTLIAVSMIIFGATVVLPGNAAVAVLGEQATPERLAQLEQQMNLDEPVPARYLTWLQGILTGDPGLSLLNNEPVTSLMAEPIRNSLVLVLLAGGLSAVVGILLGILCAARRDTLVDRAISSAVLIVSSLPDFILAVIAIVIFATVVLRWLPAVSMLPPGVAPWEQPTVLILPVLTLVIGVAAYIIRMTRAAMIDVLESDYIELAELKGMSWFRVLFTHALPNALPPVIQVVGLTFAYLAGGIVVVEYAFNYPGMGTALVDAVSSRDIPVIQFLVLLIAVLYVLVNIVSDILALVVTPRRRIPRSV